MAAGEIYFATGDSACEGARSVDIERHISQVLISIQALILGTASPIGCEPGYESQIGVRWRSLCKSEQVSMLMTLSSAHSKQRMTTTMPILDEW